MADLPVAFLKVRLPDPSSIDLGDKVALLKYLEQLNQTISGALDRNPQMTTPRHEYLLIAQNGEIRALRLNDDGTLNIATPGKTIGS